MLLFGITININHISLFITGFVEKLKQLPQCSEIFYLSLRSSFANSRARCSQPALFLASMIDSKSSTCTTPTILLQIEIKILL